MLLEAEGVEQDTVTTIENVRKLLNDNEIDNTNLLMSMLAFDPYERKAIFSDKGDLPARSFYRVCGELTDIDQI